MEKAFNNAIRKIGIPEEERRRRYLTFHSWRHWYNTMTRGKVPDHVLQRITRHKTLEMTEHYTGLTDKNRRGITAIEDGLVAG